MKQGYYSEHWKNEDGVVTGGVSTGRGFTISWQNGPLGRGEDRREPNGAFVEDVIDAARDRIQFYQDGEFSCQENKTALYHLEQAAYILDMRTKSREKRGVEGLHKA